MSEVNLALYRTFATSRRLLDRSGSPEKAGQNAANLEQRIADVRPGTSFGREWNGRIHRVAVLADAG